MRSMKLQKRLICMKMLFCRKTRTKMTYPTNPLKTQHKNKKQKEYDFTDKKRRRRDKLRMHRNDTLRYNGA